MPNYTLDAILKPKDADDKDDDDALLFYQASTFPCLLYEQRSHRENDDDVHTQWEKLCSLGFFSAVPDKETDHFYVIRYPERNFDGPT